MKRRAFLAGLTVAGGVGITGCGAGLGAGLGAPSTIAGSSAAGPALVSRAELGEVMRRMDRGLGGVARIDSMIETLLPPEERRRLSPSGLRYLESAEPAVKRATRALIAAGARGELPPGPLPQPFAERMQELSPELDQSVAELTSLYEGMSSRAKRRVGRYLRGKPDLPMGIAESLDGLARHVGLADSARHKLRTASREVGFRMGKQSAGGFLDESASRVRRIVAHHGLNAVFARQLVTHSTSAAIFRILDEAPPPGSGGGAAVPPPPQPSPEVRAVPVGAAEPEPLILPPPEEEEGRGDGVLIAGGVLLGVGAIVLGITLAGAAGALGGDSIAWLFGVTAGALVTVGGIVTLIVGAVLNA